MPQMTPFTAQAKTKAISVTSTASTSAALPAIGDTIRLINEGPNHVYFSIGTTAQTATVPSGTAVATATPVLAGTDVTFTIPRPEPGNDLTAPTPLNFSAICSGSGTATLNVQVGEGC